MQIEFKTLRIEQKVDREKREIEGYASTFGALDSYGDTILPGAFADDIAERGTKRPMFYDHDMWSPPIGKTIALSEDAKGLYYKASLSKTPRADEILELIADETVEASSIGFIPVTVEFPEDAEASRILHKIKLIEISPVVFPANDEATAALAKSRWARFGPGLSRYDEDELEAKRLVSRVREFTQQLKRGW